MNRIIFRGIDYPTAAYKPQEQPEVKPVSVDDVRDLQVREALDRDVFQRGGEYA